MQTTPINADQGTLLPVLGTAMGLGYGHAETLCTMRAPRARRPHWMGELLRKVGTLCTPNGVR